MPILLAQATVSDADMATATSLMFFARCLGGVIGIACSGSVVNSFWQARLVQLINENALNVCVKRTSCFTR